MEQKSILSLPVAIVVAALIIGIAIVVVHKPENQATKNTQNLPNTSATVTIKPVTANDHILGNPNAPVIIVEYSDPSCPFCKIFNPTMEQIMQTYGKTGKVAWVYRSFPLDKVGSAGEGKILHPNAGHEAQALECAASVGGNDKFWAYEKLLYETTPSVTGATPNGLDQTQLPVMAGKVGIDIKSFITCLDSGSMKQKVDDQYLDGINAGVGGTPYSFLITPSGSKTPIPGAIEYSTLKSAIDIVLSSQSASAN